MPSPRLVITIIAGIVALITFFAVRGSYPAGSNWPMGVAMGALIGVYVIGCLIYGFVQGIREAQAKRPQGAPPPPVKANEPPKPRP